MISIDRTSAIPLSNQIETQLRQLVRDRIFAAGVKLPSIRQLASQLAVSTNTVVVAYDRLVAAGLIDSHGTSGFFACASKDSPSMPDAVALEAGEEQEPIWLAQQANDQRSGVLLASSGALPPTWLQDAVPASVVQRALAHSSAGMASRCPPQGLQPLREQIAMLMHSAGIAVDAGHLLTCFGGTHAIDLICRSFLQAGDTVLVEDPGYFLMFSRLLQDGIRLIPIRRGPDGLDLDELELACQEYRPRLLFMQTALHSPTGWSSSSANLHRVLNVAKQYGVLIAEDDVHGHFLPGHSTRLAALSGFDGVIYYSSFCKVLSPALRMGYIAAAPHHLKILMRTKIHSVMTTPALNEYVLLEVLKAGNWRKHLERLQRKIIQARTTCITQLSEAGMAFEHLGEVGLFLWGTIPDGVDMQLLLQDAYRNKILLVGGATFSAQQHHDRYLRFNVAFSQQTRLSEYLQQRFTTIAQAQQVGAKGFSLIN
ncbi:MAG: PLP-dependent aminotransferase family protein [Undibacterium sp.]|nr:PLP-dependent aminotransferase family protein [Undibacterium sp.]